MTRRHLSFLVLLIVCLATARPTIAQQALPEPDDQAPQGAMPPPAYLSLVDGAVTLEREARAEQAHINMPLLPADRLSTGAGRAEIQFPDGSLLHVDRSTRIDVLSNSLLRLRDGRVIFVVTGGDRERPALDYQLDAPPGSVQVITPGEFRIATYGTPSGGEISLEVITGRANLFTDVGLVEVRAGERSVARDGLKPAYPVAFNAARLDAFTEWSENRRNELRGYASSRYLPEDLQYYSSTFDRYGRWDTVEPYGDVWYPSVTVGWRPYYRGYWNHLPRYGWTWIDYDVWGWPTHHYGRWGFRAGLWFWIPARHWGPAWVSWAFAPGYVSWCPLGWNNRPLFNIWTSNRYYYGTRAYDPWSAWTVVPRHAFGGRTRVEAVAVRGGTLAPSTRAAFAVQRVPPAAPTEFAVSRRSLQAQAPAVPRALPRGYENAGPRANTAMSRSAPGAVTGRDDASRAGEAMRRGSSAAPVTPGNRDYGAARDRGTGTETVTPSGGAVRRGSGTPLGDLPGDRSTTRGDGRRALPPGATSRPDTADRSDGAMRRAPDAGDRGGAVRRGDPGGDTARTPPSSGVGGAVRRGGESSEAPRTPPASGSGAIRRGGEGSEAPRTPPASGSGAIRRGGEGVQAPRTPPASGSGAIRRGGEGAQAPRTPPASAPPAGTARPRGGRGGEQSMAYPGALPQASPDRSYQRRAVPPTTITRAPERHALGSGSTGAAWSAPRAQERRSVPDYRGGGFAAPNREYRAPQRSYQPYSSPPDRGTMQAPDRGYTRPPSYGTPRDSGRPSMASPPPSMPRNSGRPSMSSPPPSPSRGGGAMARPSGGNGGGSAPRSRGGSGGGGGTAAPRSRGRG
jgi:hypothetical protein